MKEHTGSLAKTHSWAFGPSRENVADIVLSVYDLPVILSLLSHYVHAHKSVLLSALVRDTSF